jgi:hypothetical protein
VRHAYGGYHRAEWAGFQDGFPVEWASPPGQPARHLWPAGVHVAVMIVDGVVDLPRTRAMMKDKPDTFFVKPDDLADSVFRVTEQKRSTWSFEVETQPFGEKW